MDLGAASTLIAVDRESAASLPEVASVPVVALEDASALRPDLVLVRVLPRAQAAIRDRIRAAGGAVVEVAPQDYDGVFALYRGLGARLVGAERAAALEARLGRELGELGAASHGRRRPRVAPVVGLAPFALAPAHSFGTDLVELAGGTSTAHDHSGVRPETAAELAASAPDLVLVLSAAPPLPSARATARRLLGDAVPIEFFVLDTDRFWVRGGAAAVRRLRERIESLSR